MKILIINYRYYESGGAERYMFNVTSLLERHGHTVIPFSLRFRMNRPSPYEKYFADPPGNDDGNFYYKNLKKDVVSVLSLLGRQFYSKHVYNRLTNLIRDEKPDIAYVFHFLHKMSPSVIDACYDQKIPVVVRVSDFGLICPKNSFYRDNAVCEKCQTNLWNSVKYNCVKDSKTASLVNYAAYQYNYARGFQKKISAIVSPSEFTITRFRQSRYFQNMPFHHIPTFVNSVLLDYGMKRKPPNLMKIIYWGRISFEKGIQSLLWAMKQLKDEGFEANLELIGDGEKIYIDEISRLVTQLQLSRVTHIPFMEKEALFNRVKDADVAVVPSVWYENMPNSLLEAQALGIPVIVSDIGSLTELIQDGRNGFLFKPGDSQSLADAFKKFFDKPERHRDMCRNSYQWAVDHYSAETHYQKLMDCFDSIKRKYCDEKCPI
ncbi:glycosyltransferase [bacterium]|nr:glycosyltransferase [bacterium]